ncbi:MAG TPA: GAF domain-containing protein, partial [Spirochaetes bacterium]|nr:GAF domain-containing protein [Spirochaetota bacterium]
MNNLLKNFILTLGLFLTVVAALLVCAAGFTHLGLGGPQLMLFVGILLFAVLPIVSHGYELINSIISPTQYNDLYVQTVDSILNMGSFDEVLRDTFDQILSLINVQIGFLIFYYHDRDEFNIFYQKNKRKRIIRRAKISQENILFKVVKGPDDVIIKSALRPLVHIEKAIIDELDRLNSEVVVPIYYHDMFQGMIITGERKRRLQDNEIRLLKIFASRIAILSVNSFFFEELLRKKELEKEYELASRVQKKFLPGSSASVGNIQVRVFHEPKSLIIREYYDIFLNDAVENDLRISAYRIMGNILGTSILMPGIQSMLQSYARLGFSPGKSVLRLKKIIKERELMEENLLLLHGTVDQNGQFSFTNDNYQSPLFYDARKSVISEVKKDGRGSTGTVRMKPGDAILVAGEAFNQELLTNKTVYVDIIEKHRGSADKILDVMIGTLRPRVEEREQDLLLMLIT